MKKWFTPMGKLKLALIISLGGFLVLTSLFQSFGSGLLITKETQTRNLTEVPQSLEKSYLELAKDEEAWTQSGHFGNFELTREDMQTIFSSVLAANGEIEDMQTEQVSSGDVYAASNYELSRGMYHKTRIFYQYYWETWCVYKADVWDPEAEVYGIIYDAAGNEIGSEVVGKGAYVTKNTPMNSEWDEEETKKNWPAVEGHETTNFRWGWHSGYRPSKEELDKVPNQAADYKGSDEYILEYGALPYVDIDNKATDGREERYTDRFTPKTNVSWQLIYALAEMVAEVNVENWEESVDDEGEIVIERRINAEDIKEVIDTFKFNPVWGFEGAWASEESGYAQTYEPTPDGNQKKITDYTKWDESLTGTKTYTWDKLEDISYTIDSVGNWDITENGRELYKRKLYKIPATSLLSVSNGYESWSYSGKMITDEVSGDIVVPDAIVEGDRQKYAWFKESTSNDGQTVPKFIKNISAFDMTASDFEPDDGPKLTNIDQSHVDDCPDFDCGGYQHNIAIKGGVYECDAEKLQQAMEDVVGKEDFSWSKFLMILQTLPESEELVERMEKVRDACREAEEARKNGNPDASAYIYEPISEEDTKIMVESPITGELQEKDIIMGEGNEQCSNKLVNGKMVIPDVYEDWQEDVELGTSLAVNGNYTVEQLNYLFTHFNGYLAHPNSLIAGTEGMAEALVALQDEYAAAGKPFDILGLLAIANTESAYGTSNICQRKYNFIGWGAVDWNPGEGAWQFKSQGVCDALCNNFRLIIDNYIYGKYDQDTYYKMRYNDNVHQYCTSTTWPSTNAIGRRQMMKCLGISPVEDLRALDVTLTEEQNEALRNYVGVYYSEGSMFPPTDSRRVTSQFGYREAPLDGASTYHKGVDIGASTQGVEGDIIRSAITGYVSQISYQAGGAGQYVVIVGGGVDGDESQNIVTTYMHMIGNSPYGYIHVGDVVEAGQVIGLMGNTGVSSGPHLHFQVEINNEAVDPLPYLYGTWNIL